MLSRLVCEHAKEHCSKEVALAHLQRLANIDESSPEALQFISTLCEGKVASLSYNMGLAAWLLSAGLGENSGMVELKGVVERLVKYLDYPHNRSCTSAWTLLHHLHTIW